MKELFMKSTFGVVLLSSYWLMLGLIQRAAFYDSFGLLSGEYLRSFELLIFVGFMSFMTVILREFVYVVPGLAVIAIMVYGLTKIRYKILSYPVIFIIVIFFFWANLVFIGKFGVASAKKIYQSVVNNEATIMHVELSEGQAFSAVEISCGERFCAFLANDKVIEIPVDKIASRERKPPTIQSREKMYDLSMD